MLKKNNRTKDPALLVSAQFVDSKQEKNKKKKSTLKIYTEFLSFPFFG